MRGAAARRSGGLRIHRLGAEDGDWARAIITAASAGRAWEGERLQGGRGARGRAVEVLVQQCISDDPYHQLFVFDHGGHSVGYAHAHRHISVETGVGMDVADLKVIGTHIDPVSFIRSLVEIAREQGCDYIDVCVDKENSTLLNALDQDGFDRLKSDLLFLKTESETFANMKSKVPALPPGYRVRWAERRDQPRILELMNSLLQHTGYPTNYETLRDRIRKRNALGYMSGGYRVLEGPSDLVAATNICYPHELSGKRLVYIFDFVVDEAARKQKLGFSLLGDIFELATTEGVDVIAGEVDTANQDALGFWRRMGGSSNLNAAIMLKSLG